VNRAGSRPSLLIISFSPIVGDARVLKQVRAFHERYDVTTVGFGPAPDGVVEHLRIPDDRASHPPHPKLLVARLYRALYRRSPDVAWARAALRGRRWDVVLADDVEAVPLARWTRPRGGVHADLHEYSPRLHEEDAGWNRWVRPYMAWMFRRHVRRTASQTTVGAGLARQYQADFGFLPEVATNAAPYVDASPRPTASTVRLVHSGAALRSRTLGVHVEALRLAPTRDDGGRNELHFYLTRNDPGYLAELTAQAAGLDNVVFHDPVPYSELASTLRGYDVGVMVLAPVTFSYRWALPNKIFDFVQARLGVIVGPSPEMAGVVEPRGLGVVTADFTAETLAAALRSLTPSDVDRWKAASHEHARELSAEQQIQVWERAIDALAVRAGAAPGSADVDVGGRR